MQVAKKNVQDSGPGTKAGFAWRYVWWMLLAVLFLFALLAALLRYVAIPMVAEYRQQIETKLSEQLGTPVHIGSIEAYWPGIGPGVLMRDVFLGKQRDNAPLRIRQVQAELSWRSFLYAEPTLSTLKLLEPQLHARRDTDGQFVFAGIAPSGKSDPRQIDWLLRQDQLHVENGTVLWLDDFSAAPPLRLRSVDIKILNKGGQHRFEISASSPQTGKLVTSGNLNCSSLLDPQDWRGQAQLDWRGINVTAAKPWLNLPWLANGEGRLQAQLELTPLKSELHMQPNWRHLRLVLDNRQLELGSLQGNFKLWQTIRQRAEQSSRRSMYANSQFVINGLQLEAPELFSQPLQFDKLTKQADWQIKWPPRNVASAGNEEMANRSSYPQLSVQVQELSFTNKDLQAELGGEYAFTGQGPGNVKLEAKVERLSLPVLWRYLPQKMGEETINWLRGALREGVAENLHLRLQGDLQNLPFASENDGLMQMQADLRDVRFAYGKSWPSLDDLQGEIGFDGRGLRVQANEAKILAADIRQTTAEIPDLFSEPVVNLQGKASGSSRVFIEFVEKSPVKDLLGSFVRQIKLTGRNTLDLDLELPLKRLKESKVTGKFHMHNNRVLLTPEVPPLDNLSGIVEFDSDSFGIRDMRAVFLGAPITASSTNKGDGNKKGQSAVTIDLQGGVVVAKAQKQFKWPLLSALGGATKWRGQVVINKSAGGASLKFNSDLRGLVSRLPPPFGKSANRLMPVNFTFSPRSGGSEEIYLEVGKLLRGRIERQKRGGRMRIRRGALGVGASMKMPLKGLHINVNLRSLDVGQWQQIFRYVQPELPDRAAIKGQKSESNPQTYAGVLTPDTVFDLRTPLLDLQGLRFDDVKLKLRPQSAGFWLAQLNSLQAVGELRWDSRGQGTLHARMERLLLAPRSEQDGVQNSKPEAPDAIRELPGLDIEIDQFSYGKRHLGAIKLLAENDRGFWNINKLQLRNGDTDINGKGVWVHQDGKDITQMELELESANIGTFLGQLDFGGQLKRGEVKLTSNLWWRGPPLKLDFSSLSGQMSLQAEDGRFEKIDPGVGKLLGLLSLQAIPRRLSFDFRDIFDDGFAFDDIESSFAIKNGIMHTEDDLELFGPAGQVTMRGEVNLVDETQDLRVSIYPELGSIAALGVMLTNPALGVAAFAATLLSSKVLQNPLNRMFSQDYQLTGSWSEPVIGKPGESTVSRRVVTTDCKNDKEESASAGPDSSSHTENSQGDINPCQSTEKPSTSDEWRGEQLWWDQMYER